MWRTRILPLWLTVLSGVLMPATLAHGGLGPSFSVNYSSWHATDIVVVNDMGRVLETWKGNLEPNAREHIIADLSVNYIERHIFLCGFSVDEPDSDYGIDLSMNTYNDRGEIEPGHVLFQVKATDSLKTSADGKSIPAVVQVADVKRWQDEWAPVILVMYDATTSRAWWVYVQQYLEDKNVSADDLNEEQQTVTVRLPAKNRLGRGAIKKFRKFLSRLQEQLKGNLKHGG